MERIPIYDAKARLSEFGRLAKETGKRFIVTNRGKDMFEIGPVGGGEPSPSKQEAMDAILALAGQWPKQTAEQTRADIEDGRR